MSKKNQGIEVYLRVRPAKKVFNGLGKLSFFQPN